MPEKKITCLAVDDEPPALEVLKRYIASVHSLELAGACLDAVEALNALQRQPVDLLFLDIQMPQILGTDFIRTLKNPPKVIFTTAFRKYAVEGFELDAVDYLLKPISFDRFLKAVNKVVHVTTATNSKNELPDVKQAQDYISFRSNRRMIKVAFHDILYIESIKDYIKVVTSTSTVITKQPISSLEEILPADMFIRIHRSYIVSFLKSNRTTMSWFGLPKRNCLSAECTAMK